MFVKGDIGVDDEVKGNIGPLYTVLHIICSIKQSINPLQNSYWGEIILGNATEQIIQ